MTRPEKPVVIVTGASRGIGKSIALCFGARGCRVVVNYHTRAAEAESVARQIREQGGEAFSFPADVSVPAEADALVEEALRQWGTIDVLINNAGLSRDGLVLRMEEQSWDEVLSVNLSGPFYCMRAAAGVMMEQCSGHIISLASISGVHGREGQANYAASKAGLLGLTKAVAKELGRFNIKVNAVLPGFVLTDLGSMVSQQIYDKVISENTLGRPNDAQEVAEFIVHLAAMRNVSGQVFNLDSRIL